MTPEQIADLRAKAQAATPGTWHVVPAAYPHYTLLAIVNVDAPIEDGYGKYAHEALVACVNRLGENADNDAAYIAAANPAVVLELLDDLQPLRAEIAALRARITKIGGALKALLETCDNWKTIPDGSPIYPMIGIDLPELCALRAALKEASNV